MVPIDRNGIRSTVYSKSRLVAREVKASILFENPFVVSTHLQCDADSDYGYFGIRIFST